MDEVQDALRVVDASLAVVRRKLSIIIALMVGLTAVAFLFVADPVLLEVKRHVLSRAGDHVEIIQWSPTEYVILKVKFSVLLAAAAVSPLVARYVRQGVRRNLDRDLSLDLSPSGLVLVALVAAALFLAGVAYAYYLMMPVMMEFLVALTPRDYAVTFRISSFYGFVALLVLAFGFVFELPLALNLAVRSGAVSYETLSKRRREAYLGIIVIGSVLTPPEVVSQLIMAAPLILFYEIGLLTLRLTGAASTRNVAA